MITRLTGICHQETSGHVTIVAGGIGWSVLVPERVICAAGQSSTLYISWRWNSDQGPSLYGFSQPLDREIFELLLTCSGVGPKLGLAALSSYDALTLIQALASGNIGILSTIAGFGKKRAETVLLHIQEKAANLMTHKAAILSPGALADNHLHEVLQALTSLGYNRTEISQTTNWLMAQPDMQTLSFEQLLRKGLAYVSSRQN